MTKQNAATSKSRIAALSMNDWCKVVARMASCLTVGQAEPLLKKMSFRLANAWQKSPAKMHAHILSLVDREAA